MPARRHREVGGGGVPDTNTAPVTVIQSARGSHSTQCASIPINAHQTPQDVHGLNHLAYPIYCLLLLLLFHLKCLMLWILLLHQVLPAAAATHGS